MRTFRPFGRIATGCATAALLAGAAFGADETEPFAFRLDTVANLTAATGETREIALSPDGVERSAEIGYSIVGAGVEDTVQGAGEARRRGASIALLSSGSYVFTYAAADLTLVSTVEVAAVAADCREGLDTVSRLAATVGETREIALSPDGVDRQATVGYSIVGAGVEDTVLNMESTCGRIAALGLLSSGTYVFTYASEDLTLEEPVEVLHAATPVKEGLDTLPTHVVPFTRTGAPVQPLSFSACDWGLGDGRAVQVTVAREGGPAETLATFFDGEEGWLPWTPLQSGTYLATHRTADAVETAEFVVRADYAGGADNPWDVSSGGDGSVLAYVENGMLHIVGSGRTKDFEQSSSVPWAASFADISSVVVDDGVKLGANALAGLKGEGREGVRIEQSLSDVSTMSTGAVMSAGMTSFTIDPITHKADIGLEVMASVTLENAEWAAVTNFEVEVSAEGPQGFYRLDIKPNP